MATATLMILHGAHSLMRHRRHVASFQSMCFPWHRKCIRYLPRDCKINEYISGRYYRQRFGFIRDLAHIRRAINFDRCISLAMCVWNDWMDMKDLDRKILGQSVNSASMRLELTLYILKELVRRIF